MNEICLGITWADALRYWMIFTSAVTVASWICKKTPTPDPNTWGGKAYHLIEILGMVTGHAKELGLPVAEDGGPLRDAIALVSGRAKVSGPQPT